MSSQPEMQELLRDIRQKAQAFTRNGGEEGSRRAVLASARALIAALETPAEVLRRMNWFEVSVDHQ